MTNIHTHGNQSGIETAIISGGVALLVLFILLIVFLVAYAVGSFLLGRLFKKAGVPQWVAWVPFYNMWKLLELGDQKGFWALFTLLPYVGFIVASVFMYISMFRISKKLGKEDWFILIAIFLPVVWLIWLGFDDSKWPTVDKEPTARKKPTKKVKS